VNAKNVIAMMIVGKSLVTGTISITNPARGDISILIVRVGVNGLIVEGGGNYSQMIHDVIVR
jgi:hypothetical protein